MLERPRHLPRSSEFSWRRAALQEPLDVVVVDDDAMVRDVTAQLLQREGYRVHQCKGGTEALRYLAHNKIDLLFTDLNMPNVSGVQLIAAVLERKLLTKDRIVAVTGLTFDSPDVRWLTGRKILVL